MDHGENRSPELGDKVGKLQQSPKDRDKIVRKYQGEFQGIRETLKRPNQLVTDTELVPVAKKTLLKEL